MAQITNNDLTTEDIEGTGLFDQLMRSVSKHISKEVKGRNISSTDFSKLYLGALDVTMNQAIQFLLQKQTADKQADLIAAQITKTNSENDLVQAQILKVNAEKALVDQQLANAVIEGTNLGKIGLKLDAETALLVTQETKVASEKLLVDAQKLKVDSDVLVNNAQISKLNADTSYVGQQEANAVIQGTVLTAQELKVDAETALLNQKKFTEEAQILDTVDGNAVVGVVGKQKDLYTAQRDGFIRDAEQKLSKMVIDAWSVRSTVDPATMTSPSGIADADLTQVLNVAKQGIGLP